VGVLVGCANRAGQVVLLPQADGSSSAVIVTVGSQQQKIDQPFASITVTTKQNAALEVEQLTEAEVKKEFKTLYKIAPPAPLKFILYFEKGGTELTQESLMYVPEILKDVNQRLGSEVLVIGHTDTDGAAEANDALSLKRAKAVSKLLVDKGVSENKIEPVGRGERELLIPTADEVAEAKNRRVEIIVR
jgi:outer membrane protein OmpA-like peptidoglycan-associated protein